MASPANANIGQTVVFAAAQSGATEPVSYSWSGSVSGYSQSQSTSFNSAGTKSATVTITNTLGQTRTATCSTNVSGGTTSTIVYRTTVVKEQVPQTLTYGDITMPEPNVVATEECNTNQPLFASIFASGFSTFLWYIFLILLNIALIFFLIWLWQKSEREREAKEKIQKEKEEIKI